MTKQELLRKLEIAVYKIGEMLHHGEFEEEARANFERNYYKLKNTLDDLRKGNDND